MSGSILITGGNAENRKNKALQIIGLETLKENPDLKVIDTPEDKNTIGIEQIRECNNFIHQRPFSSKHKYAVFLRAEKITPQAQNALLKTLEEPPSYAQIILCAKTESLLLDTVVSRCKRVRPEVGSDPGVGSDPFLSMTIGERLSEVQKLSALDKDEMIEKFEGWIRQSREELIKNKGNRKILAENVKLLIEVKESLESINVNTKLALEYLSTNLK